MNGFEFRQAQLADPDLTRIPLIAYSGVTDPSETAQHLHADAYVHKPTDMEQMAALVRQFLPEAHRSRINAVAPSERPRSGLLRENP